MLGTDIEDETSPLKKRVSASNISVSTTSAAAQHKIEEEIIAEEIKLAQQQANRSALKNFGRRKSSDAGMVEDFDNNFDDAGEDIVDEVADEDDLRMIDEEIMNTALGKSDARKIKDLITRIDGTGSGRAEQRLAESLSAKSGDSFSNKHKQVDQQTKFSSSSKVVVSKYSKSSSKQNLHESNSIFGGRKTPTDRQFDDEREELEEPEDHHLEPLGANSEDDIDEFIKRHLEDEKTGPAPKQEEKDAMTKAKELLGEDRMPTKEEEADMMEESLSDSEGSEDFDGDQMTPKQALLNCLVRLGNPQSKRYSLAEREHFVLDLENIMKILTFKETVAFIFPVLDVYAAEE